MRMPDFCSPRRVFHHDLDTAFAALGALGVDPERITVRSAGPGWRPGVVVGQSPAPDAPLTPRTPVSLTVVGAGGVDLLPYPLREGDHEVFGVDALLALFDSPLHKLALHVRRAGGFLALRPDEPATALRWIEEIFGLRIDPVSFPSAGWYPLARFLPALHRVAGTE
ncbi:MAG TPA: PASTA domain-containing protein, partial [Longimicrobium sp.]|nr:PASTA domain-containing protein [Longimicrobium sp.]